MRGLLQLLDEYDGTLNKQVDQVKRTVKDIIIAMLAEWIDKLVQIDSEACAYYIKWSNQTDKNISLRDYIFNSMTFDNNVNEIDISNLLEQIELLDKMLLSFNEKGIK